MGKYVTIIDELAFPWDPHNIAIPNALWDEGWSRMLGSGFLVYISLISLANELGPRRKRRMSIADFLREIQQLS
ncbi:MAG: hypothetical protein GWN86_10565, partial [Desulfobacterales bacterium]|nr:hypothetical protein [Desulfobacterales bacterium]